MLFKQCMYACQLHIIVAPFLAPLKGRETVAAGC